MVDSTNDINDESIDKYRIPKYRFQLLRETGSISDHKRLVNVMLLR